MLTRRLYPLVHLSEDLDMLRRQLDQVFEPAPQTMAEAEKAGVLPLELSETPQAYKVRAMLPGLHPEQVNVTANHKTLTIEGEWTPPEIEKDESVHVQEFRYGKFRRSVAFSTPIVADDIEARFHNGLLSLSLPKEEASQRKTIQIPIT